MADEKPLRNIADAFRDLAAAVNSDPENVEVEPFSRACSLVSPLFGCLGFAFKFAEIDYVAKVNDLSEASKSIKTLQSLIDHDMKDNCVTNRGSHSRNLLKVKRGLDMIRVLFEQMIISDEDESLKGPATTAYAMVFEQHHGWTIRKAVSVGMYALPTRTQLMKRLNEDVASAKIQMQSYIVASAAVITHVDQLFHTRNLGVDW